MPYSSSVLWWAFGQSCKLLSRWKISPTSLLCNSNASQAIECCLANVVPRESVDEFAGAEALRDLTQNKVGQTFCILHYWCWWPTYVQCEMIKHFLFRIALSDWATTRRAVCPSSTSTTRLTRTTRTPVTSSSIGNSLTSASWTGWRPPRLPQRGPPTSRTSSGAAALK